MRFLDLQADILAMRRELPVEGMGRDFCKSQTEGMRLAEFTTFALAMRSEPAVTFLLGILVCFVFGWELGSAPR